MMRLTVERATACTPALQQALGVLMPQLSGRLSTPREELLHRLLDHPTTALLIARDGERIVGTLTLVWYDLPSGRRAWIEDVVVDAAVRGCGAGRALVEAALRLAAEIGAERVLLTSNPTRTAARALYRSCGFHEAETSVFVSNMHRE